MGEHTKNDRQGTTFIDDKALVDYLKNLGNDDIMNLYLTEFRKKFCETKRQYLLSKRLKEIGAKVNQTN